MKIVNEFQFACNGFDNVAVLAIGDVDFPNVVGVSGSILIINLFSFLHVEEDFFRNITRLSLHTIVI